MLVSSKPPANTDAARSSSRSSAASRSYDHADGVVQRVLALGVRRRPLQHPEPVGEPVPDLDRAHCGQRAAASSIPSGSPSRVPQISVTAVGVSGVVESEVGRTARARSTNSVTASEVTPPSTASGATVNTVSPSTPRASRDVASIFTLPRAAEHRLDRRAAAVDDVLAVVDHQQQPPAGERLGHRVDQRRAALGRDARAPSRSRRARRPGRRPRPARPATRRRGTRRPTRRRPPAPAGSCRPRRRRSASPAGRSRTSSATSATSSSRPTSELSCCGRLPRSRSTLRSTGNSAGVRRRRPGTPTSVPAAAEPVLTQRPQRHAVAQQHLGRVRDQHLPAVRERHQPGGAVHLAAEVVAGRVRSPHRCAGPSAPRSRPPLSSRSCALRLDRRRGRLGGSRERGAEAIAADGEHVPAVAVRSCPARWRRGRAGASAMSVGASSHSRVESAMSVNRNVTVPDGGRTGMPHLR